MKILQAHECRGSWRSNSFLQEWRDQPVLPVVPSGDPRLPESGAEQRGSTPVRTTSGSGKTSRRPSSLGRLTPTTPAASGQDPWSRATEPITCFTPAITSARRIRRNPPSQSADLERFERHERNPLITPIAGYDAVDWRDPYVFYNEAERRWWMLIAARLDRGPKWRRGCIVLATSENLLDWDVEPNPLYVPGTTYCPECPEMWTAGGWWYLVFSLVFPRTWGQFIEWPTCRAVHSACRSMTRSEGGGGIAREVAARPTEAASSSVGSTTLSRRAGLVGSGAGISRRLEW